ncbi:hypothetical protein WN55_10957 [Dufourea novaeangliae]|uniref:Uncharacterized protein n=1 Tax=Dufourea novaeangliae TaxID=178035 RepID=A0A154PA10_DUFNO|nr:hypothetical protein WN55_10957 [Dufourea novaeangliae]
MNGVCEVTETETEARKKKETADRSQPMGFQRPFRGRGTRNKDRDENKKNAREQARRETSILPRVCLPTYEVNIVTIIIGTRMMENKESKDETQGRNLPLQIDEIGKGGEEATDVEETKGDDAEEVGIGRFEQT